ncbi:MAG: MFS transporter [Halodesulfurarchaeum sp.]|nr:MFS transporter [Halodesulfurarchaeum sp.]
MSEESDGSGRRPLVIVLLVVFVDLVGFGILIPIIPLYAAAFGASEFVVGVLLASYSITQFVFAPILGRLSDERGRRPVLLLSLAGSVIAWTLFGLAQALWVLFLARFLAGAMGGNIAAAQAYIADVTTEANRAKGLGLIGAAFGLGFVFGPAIGGLVSSPAALAIAESILPAAVPVSQFTIPSFTAALITFVNLVAAFFLLPETNRQAETRDREGRIAELTRALARPVLAILVISFFLASLAFSGMESMFVLFTKDIYGYGTAMNGYILAYLGVIIAVVQGGLVGRAAAIWDEKTLAMGGVTVEFVALVAVPFAPQLGRFLSGIGPIAPELLALLVVLSVLAVGNGFANVSLTTLVSRSAAERDQGSAFGLTQSAGSIARAIGPVVAGALYTGVAFWAPFVAGGLVLLPIGWLLYRTVIESPGAPGGTGA